MLVHGRLNPGLTPHLPQDTFTTTRSEPLPPNPTAQAVYERIPDSVLAKQPDAAKRKGSYNAAMSKKGGRKQRRAVAAPRSRADGVQCSACDQLPNAYARAWATVHALLTNRHALSTNDAAESQIDTYLESVDQLAAQFLWDSRVMTNGTASSSRCGDPYAPADTRTMAGA